MDIQLIPSPQVISDFCQKHHIRRLSLFGSILRNDFHPESDIDILIEFEPGHTPGFDFFFIEDELSKMMGRKVDLQTAGFLSPEIRTSVLREAKPVYEQT
jgi:hypothetical protein